MEFRYLGNSGLKISEITYGNWLTHGSQVENDVATQCVRAALEHGISTFDTADVYANTKAETVLGQALEGERRESLEMWASCWWASWWWRATWWCSFCSVRGQWWRPAIQAARRWSGFPARCSRARTWNRSPSPRR